MRGTAALKDCISLELSRNVDAKASLRQSPSKCQVVDLPKMAQAINSEKEILTWKRDLKDSFFSRSTQTEKSSELHLKS